MDQINPLLTTILVTFNNRKELGRTLQSLMKVRVQPAEIIIIDGGSTDGSIDLIKSYISDLPRITYISEKDNGIFDAMNKGRRLVKTKLIHYLPAGDCLYGEPYKGIDRPSLIPVGFVDELGVECGEDKVKLFGTGYNHQGMIVPADHAEYDTSLWVAADYKMSLEVFPEGLSKQLFVRNGGVKYQLGGLSTQRSFLVAYQLVLGARKVRPLLAIPVACILLIKSVIPRELRRWILRRR